jgi:hypothetical protein
VFDMRIEPTDALPALDYNDVLNYHNGNHALVIEAVSQGRKLFGKIVNVPEQETKRITQSFYTITICFAGHIDRVVHFRDEVFVLDYKTSKYPLTLEWINGFDRSTQFFGYFTAAAIMASQPNSVFLDHPAGVLVDGLQLQVNATRFARFPLRYSPTVANEFLENLEALVRIKAETAERLRLYPTEAESECDHYRRMDGTGGCEFRKVCNAPLISRERELQQNFTKSTWDPSKSR